jgi:hypothetical protein
MNSMKNGTLLGEEKGRSYIVISLAAIIFALMFLTASNAAESWMTEFTIQLYVPVLILFYIGGSLAAWNAYWNDGLIWSWLLVFNLIAPWEWFATNGGHSLLLAGMITGTLTLFIGTVGYGIGRYFKGSKFQTPPRVPREPSVRILLGADLTRVNRWKAIAGGLFVVWGGLSSLVFLTSNTPGILGMVFIPTVIIYQPELMDVSGMVMGAIVFAIWIAVAAWPAYSRNGILVSWGLIFAPFFGTALAYSFAGGYFTAEYTASFLTIIAFAFLIALGHAVVVGTIGFLLSLVIRQFIINNKYRPDVHNV